MVDSLEVVLLAYDQASDWHTREAAIKNTDHDDSVNPTARRLKPHPRQTVAAGGANHHASRPDTGPPARPEKCGSVLTNLATEAVGTWKISKPHLTRDELLPFTNRPASELQIWVWNCLIVAACDTGSTASLASTEILNRVNPEWPALLEHTSQEFAAVDERPLTVLGKLSVPAMIGAASIVLSVAVIDSREEWFVIGTRSMERIDAAVVVGQGLMLNVDKKINEDRHGHDREHIGRVGRPRARLPSLHVRIHPKQDVRIPGLSQAHVVCRLKDSADYNNQLELYQDMQFLIRPCLCVIKTNGVECKTCEFAAPSSPWQLATLKGDGFVLLYQNPTVTDITITRDEALAASYTTEYYTTKELAKDISTEMSTTPLEHNYSELEVESFNQDMMEFNRRLSHVIAEPPAWGQKGYEPPMLFEVGDNELKEDLQHGVDLKDYLASFPCDACRQELGSEYFCSPGAVEECKLRSTVPTPLVDFQRVKSEMINLTVTFDYSTCNMHTAPNIHPKHVLVVCHRKNMHNLAKAIRALEGETELVTTNEGIEARVHIARFYDHKTIHLSTEFLRSVASSIEGEEGEVFIHLTNCQQWGVSNNRLRRIFHKESFTIIAYRESEPLQILEQPKAAPAGRRGVAPQPAAVKVPLGLPKAIQPKADQHKVRPEDPVVMAVDPETKKKCLEMLQHPRFDNLWSQSEMDVGQYLNASGDVVHMSFRLTDFKPVLSANRFVYGHKAVAAANLVETLIKHNVARPAVSRIVSQSVYVRKAKKKISLKKWKLLGFDPDAWTPGSDDPSEDPGYRLTLDFSQICGMYEAIPIASTDPKTILANMGKFNCISLLDISQSFFALTLCSRSCETLGFHTGLPGSPYMQFQRCVMGHPNSSAMLAIALTETMKDYMDFVTIYADDIVVYSDNAEQGVERLALVLMQLEKRGFKIKRHKLICLVEQCPVKIYGMTLDMKSKKLFPEKGKLLAVLNRRTPSDKSGLKSLIGAFQWQVAYLRGCAGHMATLNKMTRTSSIFTWDEASLVALEACLDALAGPNAFTYLPNGTLGFLIVTDASDHAAGSYLVQVAPNAEARVVSYATRSFDNSLARASPAEKELSAIVNAILCYWSYIEGRRTLLLSDSRNAIFLTSVSKINSKMARIQSFLSSLTWLYTFWVSGKSKALLVADFLSRPHSSLPKAWRNRKPTGEDLDNIEKASTLLPRGYILRMRDCDYAINSITSEAANTQYNHSNTVEISTEEETQINSEADALLSSIGHGRAFTISDIGSFLANEPQKAKGKEALNKTRQEGEIGSSVSISEVGEIAGTARNHPQTADKGAPLTEGTPGAAGALANPLTVNGRDIIRKVTEAGTGEETQEPDTGGRDDFDPHNTEAVRGTAVLEGDIKKDIEAIYGADLNEEETMKVFFGPMVSQKPIEDNQGPKPPDKMGRFLHIIAHKICPQLSLKELARHQKLDPILADKISECEAKDGETLKEGPVTWVLGRHGTHPVLCREVRHDAKHVKDRPSKPYTLQLCIPRHQAYTMILYVHRSARGKAGALKGSGIHAGIKKTCILLTNRFYIPHLSKIVRDMVTSCDQCVDTRLHTIGRQNFVRRHDRITRPASVWSVDEIQVSTVVTEWGFNKVITFACAVTRYIVMVPLTEQLTNEYFIKILMLNVIAYFGKPMCISTDGASTLSGAMVREVCAYLSVGYTSTPPYRPQPSVAEIAHRLLLASLRQARQSFNLPTNKWCYILAPTVNYLNYTPYIDATGMTDSPAYRMFGPGLGANVSQFYSEFVHDISESFEDASDVARLHQISFATLQQRRIKRYRERVKAQSEKGDFLPGDIVALRSLSDNKTDRRNRLRFVVHATSNSSLYIRPWEQGTIQRWLDFIEYSSREKKKCPLLPCCKVDKSRAIKLNKNILQLYNSNQDSRKGFWAEPDGVEAPPREITLDYFAPVADHPSMFEEESELDKNSNYESLLEYDDGVERLQTLGHDVYGLDKDSSEFVIRAKAKPSRQWYKKGPKNQTKPRAPIEKAKTCKEDRKGKGRKTITINPKTMVLTYNPHRELASLEGATCKSGVLKGYRKSIKRARVTLNKDTMLLTYEPDSSVESLRDSPCRTGSLGAAHQGPSRQASGERHSGDLAQTILRMDVAMLPQEILPSDLADSQGFMQKIHQAVGHRD